MTFLKKVLAFGGAVLGITSISYLFFYHHESSKLSSLDSQTELAYVSSAPSSAPVVRQCTLKEPPTLSSNRIIAEHDTVSLKLVLSAYKSGDVYYPCQDFVSISALDMEISPDLNQKVVIPQTLSPQNLTTPLKDTSPDELYREIIWNLKAVTPGRKAITVSAGNKVDTIYLKATNVFGLSPTQAKLLSSLGSFLGTAATFPWWFELWERRRKEAKTKKNLSKESALSN
ncbi:MAG: hypothetical protein SAK29_00340 [Scytonema sp. PMC 1069.18]|nr:hypothetical protein [Scytonema sp. PMC 1069.18]MEC4880251.1 hypothetical protein [Scytonema sp. PMC 1070.18]